MQKFFADVKSYKLFRSLIASEVESVRIGFHGVVGKAYLEKQNSEDDTLKTYKITSEELLVLWSGYKKIVALKRFLKEVASVNNSNLQTV